MQILELRHVECEPPAAYLPALTEHADVVTVRPGRDPLPEHHRFAGIIAMGGPMGVNDRAALPWIEDEISYLREATAAGVPVWGSASVRSCWRRRSARRCTPARSRRSASPRSS